MSIPEVRSRSALLYFLEQELTLSTTPAGSNTYIQFNDNGSMGGDANLTWDASTLAVGGALTIAGNTTLGDASSDTITLNGVDTGTDNTVLILNSSNVIKTDEINPSVWDTSATFVEVSGTPVDNQVGVWDSADTLEGDSNFTWDGSAAAADGYLDIKNTVDDGTTNRVMLRLHNYRSDDAEVNDFGPISIDFDIENLGGGTKTGTARITAVQCPIGTDHTTILGEKSSGLIFSTMEDDTLAEAMRINAKGYLGIGTTDPDYALDVAGDVGVNEYIYHNGDTDTYIRFTDDDINIQAGGVNFIDITQNTVSEITFNEAGADVDFRAEGTGETHLLFVDASTDKVGINTDAPATALDVHHDPTGLSDDTGGGEVVTFGTEDGTDSLAAGRLMYLNDSGVWKYADGDAESTGGSQLLAIALGTAVSDGLLLRGFFDMATYFEGSFDQGVPLYVSTTAGSVDVAAPSASGDFVRVVGYCTDTANVIYFDPDGTYIEIS